MINGVSSNVEGDFCVYCGAEINAGLYNFCPKCGNALNIDAIKLKEQQIKREKIDLLDELAYLINDPDALKVILEKTKSL